MYDHSNENYRAVLSCGADPVLTFESVDEHLKCDLSHESD